MQNAQALNRLVPQKHVHVIAVWKIDCHELIDLSVINSSLNTNELVMFLWTSAE